MHKESIPKDKQNEVLLESFLFTLFFFKRKGDAARYFLLQSRMTLPDLPLFMAAKPSSNWV